MGIFDWIEKKFSKKELETNKEEVTKKCEYSGCEQEFENVCRFCGKSFCKLHLDPLNHSCGSREENEILPRNPVRKTLEAPKPGEAPTLPAPEAPKEF